MVTCPNCSQNPAQKDPRLGILPCTSCQSKTTTGLKPQHEITTDAIKDSRKAYKDDIVQPYREGVLSKEYIDQHGTSTIKASPEEIQNARNVWDADYYKD